MTAHEKYQRACEVHRQWLATAQATNSSSHYGLAETTQRIAEEWRLQAVAEQSFKNLQTKRKRLKEEAYA